MVTFDVMSDSTESCIRRRGFRQKVMDAVQSMWFKDYIFAKKYFYQASKFPILLLLFLRTLLLCNISLVECFFFNIISMLSGLIWVQTVCKDYQQTTKNTAFWLKPWLKLILFGSSFFHLSTVLATIKTLAGWALVTFISEFVRKFNKTSYLYIMF